MAYLELKNVSKSFGNFQALKNINFEAEAGEFVVLLGPSGCGKSTLLRLITGLTEDHDGEIYIKNRRVTDLDPKDRKVAMVFQSYALYPHLTVARNISFGMEIKRLPKAERERRVLEAAKTLHLDNMLSRLPFQLSGGQRQRVAIGRCLVREPDLFLFDEPLSNLDAKLRQDMRVELRHLHQRLNATTIYVTHDQHEAMALATKIVLLKDGEIVQSGTPTELYNQPVNRFAATFVGSINLIRGELTRTGRFQGAGLDIRLPPNVAPRGVNHGAVELGLRYEDGHISTPATAHHFIDVEYVEPTGPDTFVNGRVEDCEITVRVERGSGVVSGDKFPVRWNLDRCLVFDRITGQRLKSDLLSDREA